VQLRPSQHQTFLPLEKRTGDAFNRVETLDTRVFLIVRVEVSEVMATPGLHEHPDHDPEKPRDLRHVLLRYDHTSTQISGEVSSLCAGAVPCIWSSCGSRLIKDPDPTCAEARDFLSTGMTSGGAPCLASRSANTNSAPNLNRRSLWVNNSFLAPSPGSAPEDAPSPSQFLAPERSMPAIAPPTSTPTVMTAKRFTTSVFH